MSPNVSRRAIARGAAWAAPVVVTAAAAPAFAASPTPAYRFRASYYATRRCDDYGRTTELTATNQEPQGSSPLGFTVVNAPMSNGATSPANTAQIVTLNFVLGFPERSLDPQRLDNPFNISQGTRNNWKLIQARRTTVGSQTFRVYTFDFQGPSSNATVPNSTPRPRSWPRSAFDATVATSTYQGTPLCYQNPFAYAGYNAELQTANGVTVMTTLPPSRFPISDPLPGMAS